MTTVACPSLGSLAWLHTEKQMTGPGLATSVPKQRGGGATSRPRPI
jgi:hypothetical protein